MKIFKVILTATVFLALQGCDMGVAFYCLKDGSNCDIKWISH